MNKILRGLNVASVVLGGLPEMPSRNGAVLLIDDEEAARIIAAIDAGIVEMERLRREVARCHKIYGVRSDPPFLGVDIEGGQ